MRAPPSSVQIVRKACEGILQNKLMAEIINDLFIIEYLR